MKKKKSVKKVQKFDGLGPDEIARIKTALRQVWSWSYSRRLVVARCLAKNGFSFCELCKKKCPKVFIDHITPIGTFDGEYIQRLFVPSDQLQGLCKECHKVKTKADLHNIKSKRDKNADVGDFF